MSEVFNAFIGSLLLAMVLGMVGFFVAFCINCVSFFIRLFFKRKNTMKTYTFKLYRRIHNYKHYHPVIISAFDIQIECEDPFAMRRQLSELYVGWAVGNEPTSATDEEYEDVFGED